MSNSTSSKSTVKALLVSGFVVRGGPQIFTFGVGWGRKHVRQQKELFRLGLNLK